MDFTQVAPNRSNPHTGPSSRSVCIFPVSIVKMGVWLVKSSGFSSKFGDEFSLNSKADDGCSIIIFGVPEQTASEVVDLSALSLEFEICMDLILFILLGFFDICPTLDGVSILPSKTLISFSKKPS